MRRVLEGMRRRRERQRLVDRHRARSEALEHDADERSRLEERRYRQAAVLGEEWVDAGGELPDQGSVVLRSLVVPGWGHLALHFRSEATGWFVGAVVAWAAAFWLADLFFLFGVALLAPPIYHLVCAAQANALWRFLEGYPEPSRPTTVYTAGYQVDNVITTESTVVPGTDDRERRRR